MLQLDHVQAVAFDLDGTLVDSIPDLAASANAMRVSLGMSELPAATVQSYVGDGIGILVHRTLTNDRNGQAEETLWQQGFTAFVKHYGANIANATRPYPQTEAGLGLLKTLGIPLAIITNKSEKLAVKLLKDLGLDHYFSIVVGGDTLPERKPSPEPLRYVADVLGVACENMLMVGDSHNDIIAAKAAGCVAVGVTFGYGDMQELSREPATKADWLIDSLPEIYESLRLNKTATD
ncbi:phosphoglycolate phosphatase [Wielerella bovis]|uniref:phosphoglycolate phosphatase n=1 Tax=Wielerella bovis TaxID=2917790 RepID=UPI0020194E0E|nr:phosphoglycolate phosphatase [Wielerella bovis]ULJ59468.1 phosphoglycolate phosphatase [Wielerella bovis]